MHYVSCRSKDKNFRKIGEGKDGKPGLVLKLKNGLNVLIGENDSGKTFFHVRFIE
jgi:predicted ATP-dependent endonuclease of OLD family